MKKIFCPNKEKQSFECQTTFFKVILTKLSQFVQKASVLMSLTFLTFFAETRIAVKHVRDLFLKKFRALHNSLNMFSFYSMYFWTFLFET